MKRNTICFENIPSIGSLFMEQILFSFENIPIVFVCTDNNKSRYFCVCDDIIEEESWIIVNISNMKLYDILNDVSTVLSAFIDRKIILANREFNQDTRYDIIKYNDIPKDELPFDDQYLEMKELLKPYIDKVKKEIISNGLTLAFSYQRIIDDNSDICKIVISLKENHLSGLYNKILSSGLLEEYTNSSSDDLVSIKIDCSQITNKQNTLSGETVLIADAA